MKRESKKNKMNDLRKQSNKKNMIPVLTGLLLCMMVMQVVIPVAQGQLTEEQGEKIIYELEEIAHELEHVEENLMYMVYVLVGIFLVLAGQLVFQFRTSKK